MQTKAHPCMRHARLDTGCSSASPLLRGSFEGLFKQVSGLGFRLRRKRRLGYWDLASGVEDFVLPPDAFL